MKTLIISPNDLEASEILKLAQGFGDFYCIKLLSANSVDADAGEQPLPWGEHLDPAQLALNSDNFGPVVVVVEAPDPAFEAYLRTTGRIVEVIDHHLYINSRNEILDRRCVCSSLEQFVAQFGKEPLSAEQQLIAANDRGGWPAMIAAVKRDAPYEQPPNGSEQQCLFDAIWNVRKSDLRCRLDERQIDVLMQGALDFLQNAEAADNLRVLSCGRGNVKHPELILLRAPDALTAILVDALYYAHYCASPRIEIPHRPSVHRWGNHEPLNDRPLEALIVYQDEGGRTTQVEYTGPALRQPLLDQIIDDQAQHSRLKVWAGGGEVACFLGAEVGQASPNDLSHLADRVLDAVLAGNRPLIRWRTQCLQLLRYDPAATQPRISAKTSAVHQDAPVGEPVRNYVLDYMRPYFAPRSEGDGNRVNSELCMRSVEVPGPIDPWSLTIHSYRWRESERLPRFQVRWLRCEEATKEERTVATDERPLSDISLHFLYGGLVMLEWTFQDGWPEQGEVAEAAGGSLVNELLRAPVFGRDGDSRKQELSPPPAAGRSAFRPRQVKGYDDLQEYPTLAFGTEHVPGVECLAELLDFNDAARQCYSAFYTLDARKDLSLLRPTGSEGHRWATSQQTTLQFGVATEKAADRPAGWFADLVALAVEEPFGIPEGQLRLVLDERARVITAAACVGRRPMLPAPLDQWEVLFSRFATVEPFEPQHFYDREFSRSEIAKARYDRFRTQELYPADSQLYAVTDHSLAFLGHGWFAANVAIKHVACQYYRLFLIAQLYTSVFHGFAHDLGMVSRVRSRLDAEIDGLNREIETAAERGEVSIRAYMRRTELWAQLDRKAADVRRIKARLITFANGLWFEDVSTQIQGRELFGLMTRQLRVDTHYQQIESKIARSEAQDSEDTQRRHEWRVTEWTTLGAFVATLVAGASIAAPFADGINGWVGAGLTVATLALAVLMPVPVLVMLRGYTARTASAAVRASARLFRSSLREAMTTTGRRLICRLMRCDRQVNGR